MSALYLFGPQRRLVGINNRLNYCHIGRARTP
jgi:hypothetical protein